MIEAVGSVCPPRSGAVAREAGERVPFAPGPGRVRRSEFDRRLYRFYLVSTTLVGTVPAAWLVLEHAVTALDLWLFAGFYAATAISFTLAWHRMLAHRAFDAHPVLKAVLMAFAGMAFQGKPSAFAWNHLVHHRFADRQGDPHSPHDGLFHAHLGWFLDYEPQPHLLARYLRDPVVRFFERTWFHWTVAGGLLPFLLGGLLAAPGRFSWWHAFTGLVWGGATRLLAVNHALWLGSSLGHRFGHRTFDTPDGSRNSLWLSLLLFGDGWHNNHHAAPRAANLNARPWHIDLPGALLFVFAKLGLVTKLRWCSRADWQRRSDALRARHAPAMRREEEAKPTLLRRPWTERLSIGAVLLFPAVGAAFALRWIMAGRAGGLEWASFVVWHLLAYVGMTLGYHRMLCHRAFVPHPAVKSLLLFLGGLAIMASPSEFVAQHLAHHAHADGARDPHSSRWGFFHAHMGWILRAEKVAVGVPRWMARDRMVRFFDRAHAWVALSSLLLPALFSGVLGGAIDSGHLSFSAERAFGGLLFGGALRLFFGQHLIFASASVNHTMGRREFETPDRSRNSPWLLNVLQLGEGYHNHHHALPWAASFAVHRGQLDVGAGIIRMLERAGLARRVRWPRARDWERARERERQRELMRTRVPTGSPRISTY